MEFGDFFMRAKKRIVILGTNSLAPFLEKSGQFFVDLLNVNEDLRLTVLYESDSENFNQALCVDTPHAANRHSYSALSVHRDRISGAGSAAGGLIADMKECIRPAASKTIIERTDLRQMNLRLPVNIILADEKLWFCFVMNSLPQIGDYQPVKKGAKLYDDMASYVDFLLDPQKAGIFLSRPGEELIQLYDKQSFPRGIFPRSAFYRTDFQRYSIWGFIFNRRGQLLLHQRSSSTKDNPLQWDKSIGGHVDLRDRSTSVTAKRELVEELFLPEAEFTKYLRADLGDIVDFGEWNPRKRPERLFTSAFAGLGPSDWILFRATDDNGDPLTITRQSLRKLRDSSGNFRNAKTVFMSDVYFLISPSGYMDDHSQMKKLVAPAEQTGAANDHKLVTIEELREWIANEEKKVDTSNVFTDDLLFINTDYRALLERFAESVKYLFQ